MERILSLKVKKPHQAQIIRGPRLTGCIKINKQRPKQTG